MPQVTVSIVCYNTKFDIISKCIECIEKQEGDWQGIFVDHSPNSAYESLFTQRTNWIYFKRGNINDGFGGGNNFAISHASMSEYYLLVNPDLYLKKDAIKLMIREIKENSQIGILTGKVSYPSGELQKLNKRNPRVFALLGRRFTFFQKLKVISNSIQSYEMSTMDYRKPSEVEFISGCFMLIPKKVWDEVAGFDTRYFIYFEDADITRKIRNLGYKTIYSPIPEAIHEYQRGSHKSIKIFLVFLKSMFQYFNKWGWEWK